MFFLELLFYFFMAFVSILTWERIKLNITIPIEIHIKSILLHLLATLSAAIIAIFIASVLNFSFVVVGLFTTIVTVFSWLHFDSYFKRDHQE